MMISPVYLFSYWIFAWFVVWIAAKQQKQQPNLWWSPWLALLLALAENVLSWIWLFFQPNVQALILVKYALMMLLIKIVPLWLVWPPRLDAFPWRQNALLLLGVATLYWVVVVVIGQTTPLSIYRRAMTSIVQGSNETPMFYALSHL